MPPKEEDTIHINIATYLALVLHKDDWTTIEVSNQQGGWAGKFKQIMLKKKGVKKGWPDILIHHGEGKSIYLEVKSKDGAIQAEQKRLHKSLYDRRGIPTEIVRNVDEVKEVLKRHKII